MGKQTRYENVMLRSRTVYVRLPFAPDGSRRRVALPWLKAKADGVGTDALLKKGRDVLSRIEDRLVACAAPEWALIDAIHVGTVTVQEVYTALADKDGVMHLKNRLIQGEASVQKAIAVAPLVLQWPAMTLGVKKEPTPATRKNRRRRMEKLAERLPHLGDWTTAGLQSVINPADPKKPRVGKGSTQNKYVLDAAMFCEWLISQKLLAKNPAVGVTVQRDEEAEMRCVDLPVLKKVYWALPEGPIRDGFGLMVASAGEPQVVNRLLPGDLRPSVKDVFLKGTKSKYRKRWAFVEGWFWPRLVELAKGKRSDEPLIPVDRFQLADAVRDAVQRLRAEDPNLDLPADFRPYDARHSFAARYVKAGTALKVLAGQLGHKDERMVVQLYGRFAVETSALANLEEAAAAGAVNLRQQASDLTAFSERGASDDA
jgi:site-specific recombinase XerC